MKHFVGCGFQLSLNNNEGEKQNSFSENCYNSSLLNIYSTNSNFIGSESKCLECSKYCYENYYFEDYLFSLGSKEKLIKLDNTKTDGKRMYVDNNDVAYKFFCPTLKEMITILSFIFQSLISSSLDSRPDIRSASLSVFF
jgi:hypothetical protein